MDLTKIHFGNGAGSIKRMDEVVRACKGPMTRIVVGSITAQPRVGNIPGNGIYYYHPRERWSMNSLGLPNIGMAEYAHALPYMVQKAHDYGKELWASVSGFSPEENAALAVACLRAGVDGAELNLSCPNVWSESGRKEIPALNPELAAETLKKVGNALGGKSDRISVKLSPTEDLLLLHELAEIISASGIVSFVTTCNTIPDQERLREDGTPALAFRTDELDWEPKHKGGLAGSAVKKMSVGVVKTLRSRLSPSIGIIGVGGIFDGADAYEYLEAGACAFQCTTGYIEEGNGLFEPILQYLADTLSEVA